MFGYWLMDYVLLIYGWELKNWMDEGEMLYYCWMVVLRVMFEKFVLI